MRLARSPSPASPAKDILLPGTCLPGFFRYRNKCFSVQLNPADFIALLKLKPVEPAFLPTTPPRTGAAADLSSPYVK
jgi:hypothetical protein